MASPMPGPTVHVVKPRRCRSGTMSAPVATTTSCPASRAACISGSIGKTCPTSGLAVNRILTIAIEPFRESAGIGDDYRSAGADYRDPVTVPIGGPAADSVACVPP